MVDFTKPQPDDIEHLLRNAHLRDELEPFMDDSLSLVNAREVPTPVENEFLASMLAWEQAPMLPICDWFDPPLALPPPDTLDDERLHDALWETIQRLYDNRIVLDFTDHLSDRQLYTLIYRDILPTREKRVDRADNYLHWDCADASGDPEVWLRYYATEEERQDWSDDWNEPLPPVEPLPFPRNLPRRPL